jgi:hypothetical protein
VDVPAVVAVGDLHDAGPPKQTAEQLLVSLPGPAGCDACPGVGQDVPAAAGPPQGLLLNGLGLGLALVEVPVVGVRGLVARAVLLEVTQAGPLQLGQAEPVPA